MKFEITFLSFNLPPKDESGINYLKIEEPNEYYPRIFYGGDDGPILLSPYIFYGHFLRVVFRTGRNEKHNYGFILKYLAYEYSTVSIPSNKSARAATLNGKGMQS